MPKIALNGIDINYRDEGSGDVLVMVHNLTSNIEGLNDSIAELSRHFRVIAADNRGHGHTTHCEDSSAAQDFYTFDNMVEDISQLLAHLKIDRFFLFGQAYWGANIAFHLFERLHQQVRALAVSSAYMISTDPGVPSYELLGETGRKNFIRMHALAREQGMMAVYDDRLKFGQFWSEKLRSDKRILEAFADQHRLTSPTAFVTIPHLSHERRARIGAAVRASGVPVMLLLGANDTNNAMFVEEMRRDVPDVLALELLDSGHYPTVENPRDFNRALLNFYAGAQRYAKR
ncbi:alpha/beta fold hydrolase [Paraburkholderia kururiensis]|uniref:alpha/beta fold hydrolase n=1 Tax=Paraburkholderia kururiensis TaxID=984307 RepID=UPI000345ACDD|nr:alpha/beta hydrolase [Paraburkholderia kururiensis]